MAESRNLRPYHDPESFNGNYPAVYRPGVGVVDEHGATLSSKLSRTSSFKRGMATAGTGIYGQGRGNASSRAIRDLVRDNYAAGVQKNVYADLEFGEYFDVQNIWELLKSLMRSFVEQYMKVLVAQPFEVSRLLLQVGDIKTQVSTVNSKNPASAIIADEEDDDDDDDEEDIQYFQTKGEDSQTLRRRSRASKRSSPTKTGTPAAKPNDSYLKPVSLNTVDVMSAVLSQEGARGLWRATNTGFVHNALTATMEAWFTGLISPFLHIPDPFFVDVTHSPDPTSTLLLSVTASILTGLILAPLDLIRTRLIVTHIAGSERSLRNSIKNLKFLTCPVSLILPTVMYSVANSIFKKLTPFVLFVKFGIDSYSYPTLYGTVNLVSSIIELFVKLPLETLLRRAQMSYLLKNSDSSSNPLKIHPSESLVVKFGGYSGVHRTLYDIYTFKGENGGIEGLFRGWRVGLLNILGSWGLRILQVSNDDQTLTEQEF